MIGTWPSTIADLIVRLAQVAAPCPGCGDQMPLTRVVPRGDYVWEQVVFQCHRCEIALTQAGDRGAGCSVGELVAGLD